MSADRLANLRRGTQRAGKGRGTEAERRRQNIGVKDGEIRLGKSGKTYNVYDAASGTWVRGVVSTAKPGSRRVSPGARGEGARKPGRMPAASPSQRGEGGPRASGRSTSRVSPSARSEGARRPATMSRVSPSARGEGARATRPTTRVSPSARGEGASAVRRETRRPSGPAQRGSARYTRGMSTTRRGPQYR
jgi:hypothetical protein